MNVQVDTINLNNPVHTQTGARPIIQVIVTKTHVFDANLQKRLLSECYLKSEFKSQEWAKPTPDKKTF